MRVFRGNQTQERSAATDRAPGLVRCEEAPAPVVTLSMGFASRSKGSELGESRRFPMLVGTRSGSSIGGGVCPADRLGTRIEGGIDASALIDTLRGAVPAGELRPGDKVLTRDSGYAAVHFVARHRIGHEDMAAQGLEHPVRLGCKDAGTSLIVAPTQSVLSAHGNDETGYGDREVLVPASEMGQADVSARTDGIHYVRILLQSHELIRANGVWTETLCPRPETLTALVTEGLDAGRAVWCAEPVRAESPSRPRLQVVA